MRAAMASSVDIADWQRPRRSSSPANRQQRSSSTPSAVRRATAAADGGGGGWWIAAETNRRARSPVHLDFEMVALSTWRGAQKGAHVGIDSTSLVVDFLQPGFETRENLQSTRHRDIRPYDRKPMSLLAFSPPSPDGNISANLCRN